MRHSLDCCMALYMLVIMVLIACENVMFLRASVGCFCVCSFVTVVMTLYQPHCKNLILGVLSGGYIEV